MRNAYNFPYREEMLLDFLAHYQNKNLSSDSLMALLGLPDITDQPDKKSYLYYTVSQIKIGFLPLYKTILVVKMRASGRVEWMKVHEQGREARTEKNQRAK